MLNMWDVVGALGWSLVFAFFAGREKRRLKHSRKEWIKASISAFISSVILFAGIGYFVTYGPNALSILTRLFGLYGMRLLVGVVVVGCGITGYFWKRKNQYTYGLGEIAFGMLVTFYVTLRIESEHSYLSQWSALVGAAYVIARGLNNRADGRAKLAASRN